MSTPNLRMLLIGLLEELRRRARWLLAGQRVVERQRIEQDTDDDPMTLDVRQTIAWSKGLVAGLCRHRAEDAP